MRPSRGLAVALVVAALALPRKGGAAPVSNETEVSVDMRAFYLRAMPRLLPVLGVVVGGSAGLRWEWGP